MKIPNVATNTIKIWFFTHQTQPDLGKSSLLILIILVTAQQIIQVIFQTFLTASLLVYTKIILSPVSQSMFFSIPSPVYHKISPKSKQSKYFASLIPMYYKTNLSYVRQFKYFSSPSSIYHKVIPSPVKRSEIFQVQVQ